MTANPPANAPDRRTGRQTGFTLLEVMIAMAILSVSLTSLISSQMAGIRATRYAQGVTAAAFLAEYQLVEIEWLMQRDGWVDSDQPFDGDFSDQGWPEVRYECMVDFIELPDYSAMAQAVDAAEADDEGSSSLGVQDTGEQAFGVLGMVWPIVKAAIEQSIRKANCTVYWKDGEVEHDFTISTFWTDPNKLTQLPTPGDEVTEANADQDDASPDGGGGRPGRGGGGGPTREIPGLAPTGAEGGRR